MGDSKATEAPKAYPILHTWGSTATLLRSANLQPTFYLLYVLGPTKTHAAGIGGCGEEIPCGGLAAFCQPSRKEC